MSSRHEERLLRRHIGGEGLVSRLFTRREKAVVEAQIAQTDEPPKGIALRVRLLEMLPAWWVSAILINMPAHRRAVYLRYAAARPNGRLQALLHRVVVKARAWEDDYQRRLLDSEPAPSTSREREEG